MTTMSGPGVPVGGFRTVGQIDATNAVLFRADQNGLAVAVELISTHTPGGPVINQKGEFMGFISEFDVLKALEAKKDLSTLTAEDIMAKDRFFVTAETSIEQAVKLMEEKRLLNLPITENGKVTGSVTRHDLLRAWIGLGVGMGLEP